MAATIFGGDRRGDQLQRAGKFGREGDDFHQAVRRLDEFCQAVSTDGVGERVRRMHAAARLADERAFEMNAQNFGGEP